jgi:hypothetical protein
MLLDRRTGVNAVSCIALLRKRVELTHIGAARIYLTLDIQRTINIL